MTLRNIFWIGAGILSALAVNAQTDGPGLQLAVAPRQMILVITKDWTAVDGKLQRFERLDREWQPIGPAVSIVVGRNGLGWGLGVHPMPQPGPQKKEGDGKAPAGAFELHTTFGYAPLAEMRGLKMPYMQCTSVLECVDDPKSPHYNQILDRPAGAKADWNSSEKMLMTNGQYRLGIVVEHDTTPPDPGKGSCVFMHIWIGPGIGTAGCTAMRPGDIESLVAWLDPAASPILVQLPETEYHRLQKSWLLPLLTESNSK